MVQLQFTRPQSEMATVEELVQMMNTLQGQHHALNHEISRLTAENQQFRQAGSPGLAEIATTVGQAVQTAISNANPRSNERQSLVDFKGLGKPPMFNGESSKFTEWLRKTTGFLIAAYRSAFPPVIEWVEDQDNATPNEALDRQFGPMGAERIEDVQEKSEKVHVALLALTESESFDIVFGAPPSGLEVLRRLVRRWDPLSGGERRALLRQILVPDRCNLQDLPAGHEKMGKTGPLIRALDDDIKTAALEAVVPGELEQHLAMNRARLITHEQVRSEIQAHVEARRSQFALHQRSPQTRWRWTALAKEARRTRKEKVMVRTSRKNVNIRKKSPNPNKDAVCWQCGKKGHLTTEGWSNPKNQSSTFSPNGTYSCSQMASFRHDLF